MKFGIRELLFVSVMLGLLGCTWFFVFKKANARRAELQADVAVKHEALSNLRQSTAGIDNLNSKIAELQQAITFFAARLRKKRAATHRELRRVVMLPSGRR